MMDFRGFDVVYADAEEKFIKTIILYGKTSDNFVYSKSAMTEGDKIDKDTLMELLKKGVIVSYNNEFYTPVKFADKTTYTSLTIGESTVLNSKEYT